MAYIGKIPTVGNFQVCDAISVVDAQAAYTMQVGSVNVVPESANNMIVSLNGVIQKPGSSFTVSSSTITFSSNLSTGDVIDFIQILGGVANIGTPSDGTVTSAKITYPLTTFSSTGIDDNATSTAITIDSSERVGINETNPEQDLHLTHNSTLYMRAENTTLGCVTDFGTSGVGSTIINRSAHPMKFFTDSTERMSISGSGSVGIGTGVPSQALDVVGSIEVSDGIYIGGTAAANKLDDYEEGTWTPASTFANDTASGQAGAYTKVGNMVVANFQIVFSTTSFGINVGLSGLPFTSNSTTGNASGASIGFYNGTSTTLQLYLAENSTQLNLRDIDGDIQHNSAKVTGKTLRGVVVYRTA